MKYEISFHVENKENFQNFEPFFFFSWFVFEVEAEINILIHFSMLRKQVDAHYRAVTHSLLHNLLPEDKAR